MSHKRSELTVALADTASGSPNEGMFRSLGRSGIEGVFCPLDDPAMRALIWTDNCCSSLWY